MVSLARYRVNAIYEGCHFTRPFTSLVRPGSVESATRVAAYLPLGTQSINLSLDLFLCSGLFQLLELRLVRAKWQLSRECATLNLFQPERLMPKSGVTLDAVWRIGATFPGVEKSTAYGSPALKVKGKSGKLQIIAGVPTNKSAEPGSLMIRVDRRARKALLEEAPQLYYAPDHYLGYDAVLVRLAQVTPELLYDLLATAYNFVIRRRSAQ